MVYEIPFHLEAEIELVRVWITLLPGVGSILLDLDFTIKPF